MDVVLDSIGAAYLADNLASLALGGRLVLIGLMGGAQSELNLALLLARRLSLIGSTLRTRSLAEKAALVAAFRARFGADLEAGRIRPVVDRVLRFSQAGDAHRLLQASDHFGKVVLAPGPRKGLAGGVRYGRVERTSGSPSSSTPPSPCSAWRRSISIQHGLDPLYARDLDELPRLAPERKERVAALVVPGALALDGLDG